MATGQRRWELASADGCSEPDPTWTRRETDKRLRGRMSAGGGGGWAQPSGPKTQVAGAGLQGCTTQEASGRHGRLSLG